MAEVRYQVDEVPESAWAHAFFPMPSLTPAAQTSVSRFTTGYPGTVRVTSPRPAGAYRASQSPDWHGPSDVAPDWFAPQLWLNEISQLRPGATPAGGGISYMPKPVAQEVPPVIPVNASYGPDGPPPVAMTGRKVGGRRSMWWPRSIIRWPDLGGNYQ